MCGGWLCVIGGRKNAYVIFMQMYGTTASDKDNEDSEEMLIVVLDDGR